MLKNKLTSPFENTTFIP